MSDPAKDSNGNYVDSTGTAVLTPDGKPPQAGEQVKILNSSGQPVAGHWDGTNVVEDKAAGS